MKGVPFKEWEIKAFQDGKKRQFTRPIVPQPKTDSDPSWYADWYNKTEDLAFWRGNKMSEPRVWKLPYRICATYYIKETWGVAPCYNNFVPSRMPLTTSRNVDFKSDDKKYHGVHVNKWRSPITMPEWASRYKITITDIQVNRLHDIEIREVLSEGVDISNLIGYEWLECPNELWGWGLDEPDVNEDIMSEFFRLWNKDHKKYSWSSNPWVYTAKFEVVK